MFNFSNFFLGKNRYFGQEKYWDFWKLDSFSNTLHRLKKSNFATVRGGLCPRTPCGGRVIAFKWPGPSPPRKKSCNASVTGILGGRLGMLAALFGYILEGDIGSFGSLRAVSNTITSTIAKRGIAGRKLHHIPHNSFDPLLTVLHLVFIQNATQAKSLT